MDRSTGRLELANGLNFFYKNKPGTDRHCKVFREARDMTLMKIAPTNGPNIDDRQTDRQTDILSQVLLKPRTDSLLELKEIFHYLADCLI